MSRALSRKGHGRNNQLLGGKTLTVAIRVEGPGAVVNRNTVLDNTCVGVDCVLFVISIGERSTVSQNIVNKNTTGLEGSGIVANLTAWSPPTRSSTTAGSASTSIARAR